MEAVRKVLENCDISQDMQEFIDKNKLTGKRPGALYRVLVNKMMYFIPYLTLKVGPAKCICSLVIGLSNHACVFQVGR